MRAEKQGHKYSEDSYHPKDGYTYKASERWLKFHPRARDKTILIEKKIRYDNLGYVQKKRLSTTVLFGLHFPSEKSGPKRIVKRHPLLYCLSFCCCCCWGNSSSSAPLVILRPLTLGASPPFFLPSLRALLHERLPR